MLLSVLLVTTVLSAIALAAALSVRAAGGRLDHLGAVLLDRHHLRHLLAQGRRSLC